VGVAAGTKNISVVSLDSASWWWKWNLLIGRAPEAGA
jgi:hypothetical protein